MAKEINRRELLKWGAVLGGSVVWNGGIRVSADRLPAEENKEIVLPVPLLYQSYFLSCEATAGAMAAEYFLGKSFLPAGFPDYEKYLLTKLGSHENPHKGFRGNYRGFPGLGKEPSYGYGVYCAPLAMALNTLGLAAVAKYGLPYEELAREIFAGHPVVVWTAAPDLGPIKYEIDEDGGRYPLIYGEHTVTVMGCRKNAEKLELLYNDPIYGRDRGWREEIPRWQGEYPGWGDFGGMAVVVYGKKGHCVPDYRYSLKPPDRVSYKDYKENVVVDGVIKRGPPVCDIALTVDDGYSLENLAKICDFVEKFKFPLTLFITGQLYQYKNYQEIFKKALDLGCEFQNHSWSHKDLVKLHKEEGIDAVKREIEEAQKVVRRFTRFSSGSGRYFRPPYGKANWAIVQTAVELGLFTVGWSASSGGTARKADGGLIDPWQILLNLASVGKGEIILTHANWDDVAALPDFREKILIPRMLKPVLLSELLA